MELDHRSITPVSPANHSSRFPSEMCVLHETNTTRIALGQRGVLTVWKDITNYVGKVVRTMQRWERELSKMWKAASKEIPVYQKSKRVDRMMDRHPTPAPFLVGGCLRYTGIMESYACDINEKTGERKLVALLVPGLEVTITEVQPGRQGTLRRLLDEYGPMYDDTGEPILDTTQDGYSVYYVDAWQNGRRQGRCIFRDDINEWEKISEDRK